jgi:para-aminobenzoate synthetase component 1
LKKYFSIQQPFDCIKFIQTNNLNTFTLIDDNKGDYILGWDAQDVIEMEIFNHELLQDFESSHSDYIFGYIGYDVKNQNLPHCKSKNEDIHKFPDSIFYTCKHVVVKKKQQYLYFGTAETYKLFLDLKLDENICKKSNVNVELISKTSKLEYISNVNFLKNKIQHGDIYEANYCIQFNQKDVLIDGIQTFINLKKYTKAPFSTYLKYKHIEIISASPERFYNKNKTTLISQPIKGTAPRGENELKDEVIKKNLKNNPKEIAENVMIVDLVRNDLSRLPNIKSVKTTELCKLYSFDTVHQLISTIKAELNHNANLDEITKHLFPMGSMTGAPKISACQIIDEVENFKRGIYSGTVGFISPNKNHDFNVVIRSVLFNSNNKTVSISVGGAITNQSIPEAEYKECLLKLKAINKSIVGMSNK